MDHCIRVGPIIDFALATIDVARSNLNHLLILANLGAFSASRALFCQAHSTYTVALLWATVVLALISCIEKVRRTHFARSSELKSLAEWVHQEKRKYLRPSITAQVESLLIWLNTPSRPLFYSYLVVWFVLYLLTRICIESSFSEFSTSDGLQAGVWGLGAIIFALVISVAELARGESSRYVVKVYVLRTHLLLLVSACLLSFLLLLGPQANLLVVAVIVLITLATIRAVFEIIRLSLSQSTLNREVEKLFRRELILHIESVIDQRMARNRLRQFLEERGIAKYQPLIVDMDSYTAIEIPRTGFIRDVDLRLLGRALQSVAVATGIQAKSSISDEKSAPAEPADRRGTALAYVTKSMGDRIAMDDRAVFVIKTANISAAKIRAVSETIGHCFKVLPDEVRGTADLRVEFSELRQGCIAALKDSPASSVKRFVWTYRDLANEFLNVLERYAGHYDYEAARTERSNQFWGASWEELSWLEDDVRDILIFALKGAEQFHREALLSILYLPIAICSVAIDHADNLLFQTFISMLWVQCHFGYEITDDDLRKLVLGRCLRYPYELESYHVVPKLEKITIPKEQRIRLRDSVVFLLTTYGALVKEAYTNRDPEMLEALIGQMRQCGKGFRPSSRTWDVKDIEWRLRIATDSQERTTLSKELEEQHFLQELIRPIEEQRSGLIFGTTSVLLDTNMADGSSLWKDPYERLIALLPNDFVRLFSAMMAANEMESSGRFSFANWEGKAEIERNELAAFARLFCLKLLRVPNLSEAITGESGVTRRMADWCGKGGTIRSALDALDNGNFPLGTKEKERILEVRQLLDKVCEIQESRDEQTKRNAVLSVQRTNEFRSNALKTFHEVKSLVEILSHYWRCYEKKLDQYESRNVHSIGINQIDDKAVFLEDWHVSFVEWGKAYGEGVGHGEDTFIAAKLREVLETQSTLEFSGLLDGLTDPILILVNTSSYSLFNGVSGAKYTSEYELKQKEKVKGFSGVVNFGGRTYPIFDLFTGADDKGVFVLGRELKISIEQFAPLLPDNPNYQKDVELGIEIIDLNENHQRRQEIMKAAPEWIKKISSDRTAQENYLRGRVQISVIERLRFTVESPGSGKNGGYWIPLEEEVLG